VCLWFDRKKLIRRFRESLRHRGDCLAGAVAYGDDPTLPLPDLDRLHGEPDYPSRYLQANAKARYFRKRDDWAGEREFRLLLRLRGESLEDAFVPIASGPLVGVTVGYHFDTSQDDRLGRLCGELGVPASKIVYSDTVFLNPYGPRSLDQLPRPWF